MAKLPEDRQAVRMFPEGLRAMAEGRQGGRKATPAQPLAQGEAFRLVHELEVQQIELELQNQELRLCVLEAEAAERQLRQREDEHLRKLESYASLVKGVAHELNNMLGAVFAVTQTARFIPGCPEPMAKALDTLEQAAERGRGLVHRIQDHARAVLETDQPAISTQASPVVDATRLDPRAAPGLGLAILMVDDDELIRVAIPKMLAVLGHMVEVVDGGRAGLEALGRGPRPDLVLLDVNMPDLSGLETLRLIRARHPFLPVVLATGRIERETEAIVAADPWTWLIAKPYMLHEIQRTFRQVLNR